jgi:putative DNA primase/helicase
MFILPDKAIGASNDELHVWDGDESHEDAFRPNGTLEEWQSQIAEPIQAHPLLILAMSMAFVGPCLRLVDYPEDFGLHLYGPSSRGKTTALDIAASAWGNPDQFSRTWRGTSNGFESVAAARNDTLLVLDELKHTFVALNCRYRMKVRGSLNVSPAGDGNCAGRSGAASHPQTASHSRSGLIGPA